MDEKKKEKEREGEIKPEKPHKVYFPCRCRFLRGFWLHRQRNFAVQMVRYGEVVVLA